MAKQLSIDSFFKSKASPGLQMNMMHSDDTKPLKRRSLSLKKPVTPNKSPKVSADRNELIIDLCNDDEDFSRPLNESSSSKEENNASDSSQGTVVYSLSPTKSPSNSTAPATPLRLTPQLHTGLKVRSPSSINKYYSPTKKRVVPKKSPARKQLFMNHSQTNVPVSPTQCSAILSNACDSMDDKTIFLLKIIYQYLQDPSTKHLLKEESQVLLEKCMHVLKPGMRLVCRLYWRKDCWYNKKVIKSILIGKEDNTEQKDELLDDTSFNLVLKCLIENGLIVSNSDENAMTFDEYTNVLNANDLKQICKDLKFQKICNKEAAINALRTYSKRKSIQNHISGRNFDNSRRVLKIMSQKLGPCYRLSELARRTLLKLYVLMYLGIDYTLIRERNLELMLIYDKIKKETYPIDSNLVTDSPNIIFKNNEDFERYYKALNVYEDFILETDVNKKCNTVEDVFQVFKNHTVEEMLKYKALPTWLLRFTPLDFYVKIMSSGIQELKKLNKYDMAIDILSTLILQDVFKQHKKAEWYTEKSLILHKVGEYDEAAKVLLEGLNSDLTEESSDMLRARIAITAKHAEERLKNDLLKFTARENDLLKDILEKNIRGVHIHKQPMDRSNTRGKLKYETKTADGRIVQDVEDFSLNNYLDSGEFTNGEHWEGRIVNTLFFLLFWDIIYSKPPNCPGIFLSRFQKYPLDMFCNSFYENRRSSIDDRINNIASMDIEDIIRMMRDIWDSRPEGERSGLSRDGIQWCSVEQVCRCLGARALAALCSRLATMYRHACSGFPDLTLWNIHTKKVRFVEVKSDTDRPSLKQLQWMHYLQQHGIDTEFCYVGVHTTRSRARAK